MGSGKIHSIKIQWFKFAMTLVLVSCQTAHEKANQATTAEVFYIPPTSPQTTEKPFATPIPSKTSIIQTVQTNVFNSICSDGLLFIQDLTIPDGTQVQPGELLDKRWEVENSGSCNWDNNYRVRLIAGPAMGASEELALYPARSGTRAIIRMIFTAPIEPDRYRSAWQAYNSQEEPFGDPFFIEINVASLETPTP